MMDPEEKILHSDLSLAESIRETARWNGKGEIVEAGDLLLTKSFSRFPTTCEAMVLTGETDRDAEKTFERIRSFYSERGSSFSIHLRRHADANLEKICLREKMTLISDAPGMILERPLPERAVPIGVEIRPIREVSGVVDFREIVRASYLSLGMPAVVGEKMFSSPERLLVPHIALLAAFKNNRPVSAVMTLFSHGIAGLYWVGTVPEARGCGLAWACVSLAVNEAFRRGARCVVLQASKYGEPLYRKMGFEEVTRYPWYMRLEI